MSEEAHECSLNELQFLLKAIYCDPYPTELSNECIAYKDLLASGAGRNLNIARWRRIISRHTKIKPSVWDEGSEQLVHSSCLAFKKISQILSSHMISCTLGLSSFQEWLESCRLGLDDNYEYNEATHKNAAVYFIKAVDHILHGKFFGDMDNIRKYVREAKFQEINVVSSGGEEITGYSYDCLTCSERRRNPIISIVEEAYKAVISNSKKEISDLSDENSFLDSDIGRELMGPWLDILEKHQKYLWNKLRGLRHHSKYIEEYFSSDSIDGKGLDQYGKWNGMRTIALFSQGEWLLKMNGRRITRHLPSILSAVKEAESNLRNESEKTSSKKKKAKNRKPKREQSPLPAKETKKKKSDHEGATSASKVHRLGKTLPKVSMSPGSAPAPLAQVEENRNTAFSTLPFLPKLSAQDKARADDIRNSKSPTAITLTPGQEFVKMFCPLPRYQLIPGSNELDKSNPLTYEVKGNLSLSADGMTRLANDTFINDEAINAAATMFNTNEYRKKLNNPTYRVSYIFGTHFVEKLCFYVEYDRPTKKKAYTMMYRPDEVDCWGGSSRGSNKAAMDIFAASELYFQVNEQNFHFYGIIIDPNTLEETIEDSMHTDMEPKDEAKKESRSWIAKCLIDWIKHQHKIRMGSPHPKQNLEWHSKHVKGHDHLGNVTQASVDCGLHIIGVPVLRANKLPLDSFGTNAARKKEAGIEMRRRLTLMMSMGIDMFQTPDDGESRDETGLRRDGNKTDDDCKEDLLYDTDFEEEEEEVNARNMPVSTNNKRKEPPEVKDEGTVPIKKSRPLKQKEVQKRQAAKAKEQTDETVSSTKYDSTCNDDCKEEVMTEIEKVTKALGTIEKAITSVAADEARAFKLVGELREVLLPPRKVVKKSDSTSNYPVAPRDQSFEVKQREAVKKINNDWRDQGVDAGDALTIPVVEHIKEQSLIEERSRMRENIYKYRMCESLAAMDSTHLANYGDRHYLTELLKTYRDGSFTLSEAEIQFEIEMMKEFVVEVEREEGNTDTALEVQASVDTKGSSGGSNSAESQRDQEEQMISNNQLDLERLIERYNVFQKTNQGPMAAVLDLLHVVTGGFASMIFQNKLQNISSLVTEFVYVLLPLIQAQHDMRENEVTALTKMITELKKGKQAQIGKLLSLIESTEKSNDNTYQPELRKTIATALKQRKGECSTSGVTEFLRLKTQTKRVLVHLLNFLMVKYVVDNMKLSDLHQNGIDGASQGGAEGSSLMDRVRKFTIKEKAAIKDDNDPNISSILTSAILPALMKGDDSVSKSATELLIDISEIMIGATNDDHFKEKVSHHFDKAESLTMLGETSEEPQFKKQISNNRDRRRSVVRTWLILMLQNPLRKKLGFSDCVEFTRAILLSFNSSDMYSQFTFIKKLYFNGDSNIGNSDPNKTKLQNKWRTKTDKRTLLVDDNTIIDSLKRLYEYAYNMVDEKKKEYRESSDVE